MGGKLGWMRVFIIAALLLVLLGPSIRPVQAIATRRFVKPGIIFGDTCSQSEPCSLTAAIYDSTDGDYIYMAEGTYIGMGSAVISLTDKGPHFIGGWDGTTAITHIGGLPFPIVDRQRYVSILDGQNVRRGISVDGANAPAPIAPSFINLTIIRGNATDQNSNCSARLAKGCGGGMFVHEASPYIANNKFIENIALASGGVEDYGYGGGLYIENAGPGTFVRSNLFHENYSDTIGNGEGGGLAVVYSSDEMDVTGNNFEDNNAGNGGGGVFIMLSNVALQRNSFTGNTATQGAGLCGVNPSGSAWGNAFTSNVSLSGQRSSTVLLTTDSMTFVRNQLVGNTADYGLYADLAPGAAVPFINNIIAKSGSLSAVFINYVSAYTGSSQADFKHNTLVGIGGGTAITVDVTCYVSCLNVTMVNTIISNFGTGAQILNAYADFSPVYTLFYNVPNRDGFTTYLIGNPRFVNASASDYHITAASDAINMGIPAGVSDDIDNDHRPMDVLYDIGADEFAYHALAPVIMR